MIEKQIGAPITAPHDGRRSLLLHLKLSQSAALGEWQKYFYENYYATHKF
jgi:hypothetical protein